ncbi:MAG: hypothetical protein RLZZ589_1575, partial [Cyanobacteriota bacterium]
MTPPLAHNCTPQSLGDWRHLLAVIWD